MPGPTPPPTPTGRISVPDVQVVRLNASAEALAKMRWGLEKERREADRRYGRRPK